MLVVKASCNRQFKRAGPDGQTSILEAFCVQTLGLRPRRFDIQDA